MSEGSFLDQNGAKSDWVVYVAEVVEALQWRRKGLTFSHLSMILRALSSNQFLLFSVASYPSANGKVVSLIAFEINTDQTITKSANSMNAQNAIHEVDSECSDVLRCILK